LQCIEIYVHYTERMFGHCIDYCNKVS